MRGRRPPTSTNAQWVLLHHDTYYRISYDVDGWDFHVIYDGSDLVRYYN